MNNMPEIPRSPTRSSRPNDWASKIQINGVLQKKSVNPQSNKWTKRFFLIRDGFLMYYEANERKDFERREFFNIHPKCVLPLGECEFKACREPHQPFCVLLQSKEIEGGLILASESEFERDRWIQIMERSRNVTWKNTHLGDEMIRQLKDEGLRMAIEQQDYIDRLQSEVTALSEERMRTEELEKVNQELEKEKNKLEAFTKEIQEEYDKIKNELDATTEMMKAAESERLNLHESLDEQTQKLDALDKDRKRVAEELQLAMVDCSTLNQEKQSLSQESEELQKQLQSIEDKTKQIQEERSNTELSLHDQMEKLDQLEFEKTMISEHATELKSTIQDLISQKEVTEKELKDEIRARISAEDSLKEAEQSLQRLDHAVQAQSHKIDTEAQEEMTVNVKKLKHFFEDLVEEAKMSSDQPIILRNGLMARKTLARRAKTMRYENRRKNTNNTKSCDLSGLLRPGTGLRRAVTSVDRTTREQLAAFTIPESEILNNF